MSEEIANNITWNPSLERYFKETGEKCHGYSILHTRAEAKFTRLKIPLDLGIIIIGTINGFLSVGSEQIFNHWPYASIVIGIISLICSTLSTISSYYSYGKRCEGHRQVGIQYAKLFRFLLIELGLPRDERMSPHDLLKITKESYDRLAEISPLIPTDILDTFKNQYKIDNRVRKPSLTNGLEEIVIHFAKKSASESSLDGIAYSPNTQREQTERPSSTEIGLQNITSST